jgi:hypothetical protein
MAGRGHIVLAMNPFRAGVNLRQSLLAAGVDDRELRRRRRAGEITAVRPGAYVLDGQAQDGELRYRFAIQAAAACLGAGSVISHVSAAVLHELPLWATGLGRVHATRDRRSGARMSRLLHLHAAALEPDEVVAVDGLLVTSLPRTLVDLARTLPFEQALVPADAALHAHRVSRADLDEALDRAGGRPGNTMARQVLAFARPGATNPGETRSRLAIHRAGLPPPVLQHQIRTAAGLILGEADFWWEEFDTVGEFDGRVKYGRLLRPGQDPGDVVFAEKVREDAIRADDHGVVRWIWREISPFDEVERRIRATFARRRR